MVQSENSSSANASESFQGEMVKPKEKENIISKEVQFENNSNEENIINILLQKEKIGNSQLIKHDEVNLIQSELKKKEKDYLKKDVLEDMGSNAKEIMKKEDKLSDNQNAREIVFEENENMDLNISLKEIEKMDAILKKKIDEEKVNMNEGAKLNRIQAEEESREIMRNLMYSKISTAIKLNVEEFLRLTDDSNNSLKDEISSDTLENGSSSKTLMDDGKKKIENGISGATKSRLFIERNIQLAKCGKGALSLTDEEKLRINNLLKDTEDPEEEKNLKVTRESENRSSSNDDESEKVYGFDEEYNSTLSRIDQRLQAFGEKNNWESLKKKLFGTEENEAEKLENSEKPQESKPKNKSNRLKEINRLLHYMRSVSEEEIKPLSTEEIKLLIQDSRQNIDALKYATSSERNGISFSEVSDTVKNNLNEEIITELVRDAKSLMPKFKYRFDDS